jgi:hypothetical protein
VLSGEQIIPVISKTKMRSMVNDMYHLRTAPIFISFSYLVIIIYKCCSCCLLLSTVILYHEYPKFYKEDDDDEYGVTFNVHLSHCLARFKLNCYDTFCHFDPFTLRDRTISQSGRLICEFRKNCSVNNTTR